MYTAQSQSLAALEILVHTQSRELLAQGYVVIPVDFDESVVTIPAERDIPKGWQANPPPDAVKELGDTWARTLRSVVLRVPSAIIPAEANYILNPVHPEFGSVKIGAAEPFSFDDRLARRRQ